MLKSSEVSLRVRECANYPSVQLGGCMHCMHCTNMKRFAETIIFTFVFIYLYIYLYIEVCVCVCK